MLRTRAQSLNIIGQFDALESNIENMLGPGGTRQRGSYDSLRVLRAGLDYAVLDNVFGTERGAVNGVSVRLSRGLAGLGASAQGDLWSPPPRLGERVDFYKIGGEFTRTQTLDPL